MPIIPFNEYNWNKNEEYLLEIQDLNIDLMKISDLIEKGIEKFNCSFALSAKPLVSSIHSIYHNARQEAECISVDNSNEDCFCFNFYQYFLTRANTLNSNLMPLIAAIQEAAQNVLDGKDTDSPFKSNPAKTTQGNDNIKEPSKQDCQIYFYLANNRHIKQVQAAQVLSAQLKRNISQAKVSRTMKRVKRWQDACGLSIKQSLQRIREITWDPAKLNMGERTDSQPTGDPSNRITDEDDQYNS